MHEEHLRKLPWDKLHFLRWECVGRNNVLYLMTSSLKLRERGSKVIKIISSHLNDENGDLWGMLTPLPLRASLVMAVWFLTAALLLTPAKFAFTHGSLSLIFGLTSGSDYLFNSLSNHQLQNRQREWVQNSQLQFLRPGISWSIRTEGLQSGGCTKKRAFKLFSLPTVLCPWKEVSWWSPKV